MKTRKYAAGGPVPAIPTPYLYRAGFTRNDQIRNLDSKSLKEIQKELKQEGYYKGEIDGFYGPLTDAALYDYNFNVFHNYGRPKDQQESTVTPDTFSSMNKNTGEILSGQIKNASRQKIMDTQAQLKRMGFYKGKIDGVYNAATEKAIQDNNFKIFRFGPTNERLVEDLGMPSTNYMVTDRRGMAMGGYMNTDALNALKALSYLTTKKQLPFTNGGSLTNGREMAYSNGYAYGGSMYSLPQSAASYAEGGLVEQRMEESAMMNAMAANILGGRSNSAQGFSQQQMLQLTPQQAMQAAPSPVMQQQNAQQALQQAPAQQQPGQIDVDAVLSLPYKERRIAHHNPGNIKYGKFASKYGAVAGRKATDGGNIAIFPDWQSGMKAKKDLLKSGGYKNLTLDEAMKRWSGYYVEPKPGHQRGGYGADRIAPELANKKMVDMTEDELNLIMKKMAKIEDGDVYKVIYGKAMGGELPKSYFSGGTMEIASAALGQIANMAGRVQDIANPVADPTKGDYKFNWGDALNPTKGGILMELAKKMSMDNARSKYVMGASPGNYAKGGMISKAKAREILHDGTVHGKPITEKQRRFFGAMATRKADGGEIMNMINPSAGIDMLNQPDAVRALLTGNTNQPMKMGGMMNYAMGGRLVDEDMNPNDEAGEYGNYRRRFATGGDMKLSNSSFLVNGNPSVTDGNFYPQLNAKLDHGEVVKDNFVFSNKLRDPQTNVTYAKLAQPVEKSTGKAEKFMKRFQNDAFSKNTVMQNNKFLDSLSNKQEVLATAMGLRGNDSTRTFASGGPADPYLPYGPFSKNIFQLANAFKTNPVQPLTPNQLQQQYAALSLDPFLNASQNPSASNTNPQGSTNTPWAFGPVTAQQRQDAAMSAIRGSQAAYDAQKRTPYKFDPNSPYEQYMFNQDQLAMDQQMLTPAIEMATDPTTFGTELQNVGANLSGDPIWTPSVSLDDQLKGKSVSKPNSDKFGQKWTVGDYLNAAAVLGRFGQLIGGPEVEKPVYDTTAITRQVYDPASALYQTNRQTSGMLNRMDVPSINARTSIANNMLAQRLNQDAQTLSSYQNMNAQGLRDYETRATEQRRYNVGQTLATNQMNAQNRAAYKQAVDNAMTSLGGFGTAMNQKEQAYDMLNILKTMYPEVYRRIMSGEKVTLADSEAVKEATKVVQDATGTTPKTNAYGGKLMSFAYGGKMKKGGKYGR